MAKISISFDNLKVGASLEQIYLVFIKNKFIPKKLGAKTSWQFKVACIASMFM